MPTEGVDPISQIETELRLLKVLIEGPPEHRSYILRSLPAAAIVNVRNAWERVVEKLQQNLSTSIDVLRLCPDLDAVQAGMVGSLGHVPLYADGSQIVDLIEYLLVGYQRQRYLSEMREPVTECGAEKITAREALQSTLNACQRLATEFNAGSDDWNFSKASQAEFLADILFSDEQILAPTAFSGFNAVAGGYSAGDLVILNSTSGSGKTCWMLNDGLGISALGHKVGFYTLELSRQQIIKRIAANVCDVDFATLRNQNLWTDEFKVQVQQGVQTWLTGLEGKGSCLAIKDNPNVTIAEVMADVAANGYQVVYIDYLNLMNDGEGEIWERLSDLARRLKLLARSFGIVVVVAVQKDEETGKIRYARGIKEHADIIFGWDIEDKDNDKIKEHIFQVTVEKGRNIRQFRFWLKANFARMRMVDTDPVEAMGNAAAGRRRVRIEDEDRGGPITLNDSRIDL